MLSYEFPKAAKLIKLYHEETYYDANIFAILRKNFELIEEGDDFYKFKEKSTG